MKRIDQGKTLPETRYETRRDVGRRGRWLVVDTLTGLPAASDGRDFVNLTRADAVDIAEALNTYLREGKDPPLV